MAEVFNSLTGIYILIIIWICIFIKIIIMANKILIKKSNVAGKKPLVSDLALGEIAVNTYDGKLFFKKNVGNVETVLTLDPANITSWGSITGKPTTAAGYGITDAYNSSTGVPWDSITGIPSIQSDLSTVIQIPSITGTSVIPYDNTAPLVTEGTQIATINYTASSALSKMRVSGAIQIDCANNGRNMTIALFRNNTCVGVSCINTVSSGKPQIFSFILSDLNMGSLTFGNTVTYSIRIGIDSSGTWYLNRMATNVFNGLLVSNSIVFSEFI